jgi:hypothetical protein
VLIYPRDREGHVDAGKSTLMGRVLHELGVLSDRTLAANQRSSQKMGKGSFAYAWTFDAMDEERERYVSRLSFVSDTLLRYRDSFYLNNQLITLHNQRSNDRCRHRYFHDSNETFHSHRCTWSSRLYSQHDLGSCSSRYSGLSG